MVVTLNGVRSLRRYRLVIAQKSKLRLTQEVTAALASHSRTIDSRRVASFRVPLIGSTCMAMQGTDIALHCGFVLPTMDLPVLVHRLRGSKIYFHQATKWGLLLLYRVSIF